MTTSRLMWIGAWKTVATLFGGLLAGFLVGNLVFAVLPGAVSSKPHPGAQRPEAPFRSYSDGLIGVPSGCAAA
jgi:hypothetical protein